MTMLRSGFSNLLIPGLARVTSDKFKLIPSLYPKIFMVKPSKRKYEEGQIIEGFGAAVEKNESNPVEYVDLTEGYKTTWTNLSYARGTRITEECYDDDLYSVFSDKLSTYLSRSIKQRQEMVAADVFNNGFTTNGADGVPLFSASHPYKSGGTYSNLLAVAGDLSATTLQDLMTVMETTEDAGEVNIQLVVKKLIVAPANRFNAKVILKTAQEPGSANNDINPIKDEGLQLLVWHYITSSNDWFIQGDQHGLVYWDRKRPKLEADDDFDTGDAKLKITMRCSAGYDDPRGIAGTPGA